MSENTSHFFDYLDAVRAWKLFAGSTMISVPGEGKCKYEGEIDCDNNAYGEGILTWNSGAIEKGTWLNNKKHGYCSYTTVQGERLEGEVKIGEWLGEMTVYCTNGTVWNETREDGKSICAKKVTRPEDANFGDGIPVLKEKARSTTRQQK